MFLLYDFEVFAKDWLVVFKPYGKDHIVFVNDYEGLQKFYNENKSAIFTGFNNKHYDNYILQGILSDLNPKKMSDWIIEDKKQGWMFPGLKRFYFNYLDLKQDIEGALQISLKEIESNLGMSIEESSVDFLINRKLTEEEIEEVIRYCKHDVDATEALMNVRMNYVKSRLMIIKEFKLPMKCLGMTNAQLDAEVMQAHSREYTDHLEYDKPSELQLKNTEILNFYKTPLDKSSNLKVSICGVPHVLGFGGLHGATGHFDGDIIKNDPVHIKGNIYNFDVASYYPSLIIKKGWMSRSCKDPGLYKRIYEQRIEWKKVGDPRQEAFKLILNTLSGALDNDKNKLHDSKQCNQIRITGQLFLLDLLEKLNPYIKLIQSNTDGIMFQTEQIDKCQSIVDEWQQRTEMVMERDDIVEVCQKDVNNYMTLYANGVIKSKGGFVKNYGVSMNKKTKQLEEHYGDYRSNSMTIVDEAIVKRILFNIPTEDTINKCVDPMRFQITTKKGPTFARVEWEYDDKRIVVNNTNRVFASIDPKCGKLLKIKTNGRIESDNKIASLPDHCLVFNKHIDEMDINLIDKQWYIKISNDRVNDFIGG